MTWQELKKFISKLDKSFLDSQVRLYDYSNGDEHEIDVTELLINERNEEDENDGWVPYLSINEKGLNNETETAETGINRFS